MTMQPRPNNPIELKKQKVRKYARNGVISVAAGVGGGLLGALVLAGSSWIWLSIGLVVTVVGGVSNWVKIQKIVNENNSGY
ncbi:hypothetical protein [Corynebacterium casei]|uniref:hypothetical protein n=1 Tax=Corynebacterium casei TaxID=160386 RepID=UPI002649B07A|nr:hypothetical protein [Corynebacterium casei]MDN6154862.1 hypothetical protein [Corynebacterium casei]MDN6273594.1 hypothetical protein [Corynebacterium casei]